MSLNDQATMPYGKHAGKAMINVPPDYLLWLWKNGKEAEHDDVAEYIRANLAVLQNRSRLTAADPMPYGKYKGTFMSEIPASYLMWMWENGKSDEEDPVALYIGEHLEELETEAELNPQGR